MKQTSLNAAGQGVDIWSTGVDNWLVTETIRPMPLFFERYRFAASLVTIESARKSPGFPNNSPLPSGAVIQVFAPTGSLVVQKAVANNYSVCQAVQVSNGTLVVNVHDFGSTADDVCITSVNGTELFTTSRILVSGVRSRTDELSAVDGQEYVGYLLLILIFARNVNIF